MRAKGELLAKDKMAQIIDSKKTVLHEWRQKKKESRKQKKTEGERLHSWKSDSQISATKEVLSSE